MAAGRLQARRQDRRRRDRLHRPRQAAGRPAPVRPDHPRRPAVDGQDRARHQHRLQRRQGLSPARGPDGRTTDPAPRTARSSASSRSKCRPSSSPPASSPRNPASPRTSIRRGEVRREDFDRFVLASQRLASVPLYIDDTPALSIAALRTRARRLKRQQGLGLIVDRLSAADAPQRRRAAPENRVQEISEITRGLKAHGEGAERAGARAVAAVARRRAARGQAADAGRSARIRLDRAGRRRRHVHLPRGILPVARRADAAPRRERRASSTTATSSWKERSRRAYGTAEIIIAKQRHGPIGKVKLHFEAETTKFDNFIGPERLPGGG